MYMNKKIILTLSSFSFLLLFLFFNGSRYMLIEDSEVILKAYPKICEIKSGSHICESQIVYDTTSMKLNNPVCLFINNDANNEKKLVGCNPKAINNVSWINRTGYTFSLRHGSTDYNKSREIDSTFVVGVYEDKSLESSTYEPAQIRRKISTDRSYSTSSWDGRLLFGTFGMGQIASGEQGIGLTVRYMRASRLEGLKSKDLDLRGDSSLYSSTHIIDTDKVESSEDIESIKKRNYIKNLSNKGIIGKNHTNTKLGFHLAVYPHGSIKENPYRSNANGVKNADSGEYMTYRMYAIIPSNDADGVTFISPINKKKLAFLTKVQLQVVVKDFDKDSAQIHSSRVIGKAVPLRDKNNNLIIGYEPSATLDGNLIVYSANFDKSINTGNGSLGYIFNNNHHYNNNWSVPNNVARMYDTHGAGSSNEPYIGGMKFSKRYTLAAQPLRDFEGREFREGDILPGAYPWISFKGSEVLFSNKANFTGAGRNGVMIVGERTKWITRRVDGTMDPIRGDVTGRYDNWGSWNRGLTLRRAYNDVIDPNTGEAFGSSGSDGWSSVLNTPLGQFPSSWRVDNNLDDSPFPLNPFKESYGFIMVGNRYGEIHFPNLREDLILYWPMNEPIKYDQALINRHVGTANKINNETYRASAKKYETKKLADLSGYFHTGTIAENAYYPYDYHDASSKFSMTCSDNTAKATCTTSGTIWDRHEGYHGNSLIVKREGQARVNLKPAAIDKIKDSQAFTFSFWFKKTSSEPQPVIHISNLLALWVNGSSVDLRAYYTTGSGKSENKRLAKAGLIGNNKWHHISVSVKSGVISLFVDGEFKASTKFNGIIYRGSSVSSLLSIGPGKRAQHKGNKFWIDEVYFYDIALNIDEVKTLAYLKKKRALAPTKHKYVNLGRKLFNSNALSFKRNVSCKSCHDPSVGFADKRGTSKGVTRDGSFVALDRQSPILTNVTYANEFLWDGTAPSLKTQVLHPIFNQSEMSIKTRSELISRVKSSFVSDFKNVFNRDVTLNDISTALAHYVNSIKTTGPSPLKQKLTGSAERGRLLFQSKANCVACHSGAFLSDGNFHDLGLAVDGAKDSGRGKFNSSLTNRFSMKTPSLLNISQTAPYFHDGRFDSLDEVVDFYNEGGDGTTRISKSAILKPLHLRDDEKRDLVEYLRSLNYNHSK